MESNVDRGMWAVVALLAAIIIGGVVLLAFPRLTGKMANSMDESIDQAVDSQMPEWAKDKRSKNVLNSKGNLINYGDEKNSFGITDESEMRFSTNKMNYNGEKIYVRTIGVVYNDTFKTSKITHEVVYYDSSGKEIDRSSNVSKEYKDGMSANFSSQHKANDKAKTVKVIFSGVTPGDEVMISYGSQASEFSVIPGDDIYRTLKKEIGYLSINGDEIYPQDAGNLSTERIDTRGYNYVAIKVKSNIDNSIVNKNNVFLKKPWSAISGYKHSGGKYVWQSRPAYSPGERNEQTHEIGDKFHSLVVFDIKEFDAIKVSSRFIDNNHSTVEIYLVK